MFKKQIIYIILALILISFGWWMNDLYINYLTRDLSLPIWNKPKPLEKYTIESLSKTKVESAEIKINDDIFEFQFDPSLQGKTTKKVTGLVNIPDRPGTFPIIILLRGYVDKSIYQTGLGTKRVGDYFKDTGYITLAPDFLGYGGSDVEAENIFEARFQTYTTILTLLESISNENFPSWDGKNIFIWAHSNGGQIALTTLAITENNYPTVLWAPVTEPFPYSILYYTNESDDEGKFIRKELARFEENYNVSEFSLTNYLDRINAPLEYHLGTNDDAIQLEWQDRFLSKMKKLNKDITNYNHSGADHNMNPLWSEVIFETVKFLESHRN